MFLLDTAPFTYSDPWKIPFDDRFRALAKGEIKIAYYYDYPDNSTFRYRVYNMIQALSLSTKSISAAFFSYDEQAYLDQIVDMADILVICRARYNHRINHAVSKAHRQNKTVIFDVDDLVTNSAYAHFIVHTLAQDPENPQIWDYWFGYIGRIAASMDLCDRIITTNNFLGDQLRLQTGKPVDIIPNFLNKEQMEYSEKIIRAKRKNNFARDDRIHLGYFSGTPSHNRDFDLVHDALIELLETDPRVHLRVVGYLDVNGKFDSFRSRIEMIPLQDFVNLQKKIAEVEINLVPLVDNLFTNCKSELKYFEAGVVGTISIASPTFTYREAICDGENGYLAQPFEWLTKIREVIACIDNYSTIADKAYSESVKRFAWYNQTNIIEQSLNL